MVERHRLEETGGAALAVKEGDDWVADVKPGMMLPALRELVRLANAGADLDASLQRLIEAGHLAPDVREALAGNAPASWRDKPPLL